MVLVQTPSPSLLLLLPNAKACVSRNYDTNACIKFIFDTAIDDLESRTLYILEKIGKPKLKLGIDLKWRKMRSKVILCHSKWPPAAIL